jgi:hypothetical protein
MGPEDGYEPGDINTLAGGGPSAGGDDGLVYEAGDVNTVAGGGGWSDDVDDEEEFEDEADDDAGGDGIREGVDEDVFEDEEGANSVDVANRATGGMPKAVLTYLARSLADEPDEVVVETEERRGTVVLRLSVAPRDMGRVIGRRGRTAQAIRTLVGVAGARDGIQTSVDIVDD